MAATDPHHSLYAALDAAPDWIAISDLDGRTSYVSRACETISGYPPQAYVDDPTLFASSVHPDDREAFASHQRGETERLRLRIVTRDGALRWIEHDCRPITRADGTVAGYVAVNRDVSETVALEDAHAKTSEALAASPTVAFHWSPEPGWPATYVSQNVRQWGFEPSDFTSGAIDYAKVIHPDDRERAMAELRDHLERGSTRFVQHYRVGLSDGAVRWVEDTTSVERDGDGRVQVIRGLVTDVTDATLAAQELREREALLRHALAIAGLGSWRYDVADGRFACSPEVFGLYGLAPGTRPTVEHFRAACHPGDRATVEAAWAQALVAHGYDLEYRVIVDGAVRWVHEATATERDPDGVAGAIIGTVRDVSQSREREAVVRRQAIALEQTPSIVMLTDTQGSIVYVNRRFEEVSGQRRDEVLGLPTRALKSGLNDPAIYGDLWRTIKAGGTWRGEFHNRRANGQTYWERATITPIRDEHGTVTHYLKLSEDVSTTKALREQLDHVAFHDLLTGLPNRALFMDRVGRALALTRRERAPVAVVMIGLDSFGEVNRALGYISGDRVLRIVAERLTTCLRDGDTLARFVGDEFAILLQPLQRPDDASLVVGKLREAMQAPFEIDDERVVLSASLGIAVAPADGDDAHTLVQRATSALQGAKASGSAQVRFFTQDLDRHARERLELEAALRDAVEREQLWLAYQPKVDLRDDRVVGFEALARWTHPTHGDVSPARFIPLAERSALIHELGALVLRMALRQQRRWHEAGLAVVPIAVNLSASEFGRDDLVDSLEAQLAETRAPATWLELELTESTAMRDVERTITTVEAFRSLGIRVSIDDFGTGHASFSHLKRLPVNALKIDRTFIADIRDEESTPARDAAIVQAIVGLGAALGLDVIAEGVESEAQHAFLLAAGCAHAQGYLLGRPVPADAAEGWLAARFEPRP